VVLTLGLVGVGLAGVEGRTVDPKVTVTLTKNRLVVAHAHLRAGPAMFVVSNRTQKLHLLTISGPGVKPLTRKVPAGKSQTLVVTLRQGAYMVADRVGRGPSTVRWFVVGPAASSTGNSRVVVPFPDPVPQDCD
jgi:hypothetical protein